MADDDLDALSVTEPKKRQKDIAKVIATNEYRQKAEARARVEAVAREMGYSLAERVGIDRKTARAPAPAKYRQPENPAVTWATRNISMRRALRTTRQRRYP